MKQPPHIISTRKLASASEAKLKALGWNFTTHDFIQKTMMVHHNLEKDQLDPYIVITSQIGVRAFVRLVRQFNLALSDFIFFCTSPETENHALAANLKIIGSAHNATDLADEILSHTQIKAVTHICSNHRRHELSEKLNKAGVEVHHLIAYHTDHTPLLIENSYDALLFFSPSAIDSFLTGNAIMQVPCFCIGQTTADHAMKKGYQNLFTATIPSEDALLQMVTSHFSNKPAHVTK